MARSRASKKVNKAKFVRSLPVRMPAKDVVAKATAAGIKISEKYVYNTRSAARNKSAGKKRGPGRPPSPSAPKRASAPAGLESSFRKLVLSLGLDRANALMNEVEHRLQALIAGH